MSETDGQGESRLDRVEASHFKLRTGHAPFVKEQELAWRRQKESWDRHEAWLRKYDARCERDRLNGVALDERIDKLVSGIGEFMRGKTGK